MGPRLKRGWQSALKAISRDQDILDQRLLQQLTDSQRQQLVDWVASVRHARRPGGLVPWTDKQLSERWQDYCPWAWQMLQEVSAAVEDAEDKVRPAAPCIQATLHCSCITASRFVDWRSDTQLGRQAQLLDSWLSFSQAVAASKDARLNSMAVLTVGGDRQIPCVYPWVPFPQAGLVMEVDSEVLAELLKQAGHKLDAGTKEERIVKSAGPDSPFNTGHGFWRDSFDTARRVLVLHGVSLACTCPHAACLPCSAHASWHRAACMPCRMSSPVEHQASARCSRLRAGAACPPASPQCRHVQGDHKWPQLWPAAPGGVGPAAPQGGVQDGRRLGRRPAAQGQAPGAPQQVQEHGRAPQEACGPCLWAGR